MATSDPKPEATRAELSTDNLRPAGSRPTTDLSNERPLLRGILVLLKSSTALAVIGIVPLFLIFANTQIKDLVDRFLGGCVFVIDKNTTSNGQLQVTGQIAGAMPKSIPLMFAGRDAMINTILFDEAYRQEKIVEPDDLAFHPMTGMPCPGPLCPDSGGDLLRPQVLVILTDLRSEFAYRFTVRLKLDPGQEMVRNEHLKVYALYEKGLEGGACRVQPQRWFNFWVWADPHQKALLFLSIVVIGGLLLKWAKSSGVSS